MWRDFRCTDGGGDLRFPEGFSRIGLLRAPESRRALEEAVVVCRSSDGAIAFELMLDKSYEGLSEAIGRAIDSASTLGEPFKTFQAIAAVERIFDEHGAPFCVRGGGSAYDAVAAFVERELHGLNGSMLQRSIDGCMIKSGILHLTFPDTLTLAASMLRFQEHYESPIFSARTFEREEFAAWYRTTQPHGGFSYLFDWPGFNVPIRCVEPFRQGEFGVLSLGEIAVLQKLTSYPEAKIVIATAAGEDRETFYHELAHGLFETSSEYRGEALRIISACDRAPLYRVLAENGYAPHTWDDEVQAYLVGDLSEIIEEGANDPTLVVASAELRKLLFRYGTALFDSP